MNQTQQRNMLTELTQSVISKLATIFEENSSNVEKYEQLNAVSVKDICQQLNKQSKSSIIESVYNILTETGYFEQSAEYKKLKTLVLGSRKSEINKLNMVELDLNSLGRVFIGFPLKYQEAICQLMEEDLGFKQPYYCSGLTVAKLLERQDILVKEDDAARITKIIATLKNALLDLKFKEVAEASTILETFATNIAKI